MRAIWNIYGEKFKLNAIAITMQLQINPSKDVTHISTNHVIKKVIFFEKSFQNKNSKNM